MRRIEALALCKAACALCAAVLLAAGPAEAADSGIIEGVVLDREEDPLPGARIELVGTSLQTETDRRGAFTLERVEPGARKLRISYLGFETATTNVEVTAGETARLDVVLTSKSSLVDTMTVTAPYLEGQRKALNQQRTANNVVNIVAADQIGTFPDANSAEATQRIPGVSIERDQGQGRYVLIRGTEPRLNAMMVDGNRLPSPEGDVRNVALDVIGTELIESIEVHKVLTPEMDGDSIGGAVNLVMAEPPRDGELNVTAGIGQQDLDSRDNYTAEVSYGKYFDDRNFGLQLSGGFANDDRASDNFEVEYDELALEELELRDYEIERERLSLQGALQWDPSENTRYKLKATYNEFDDQERRRAKTNVVPDGEIERELKDRFESQDIYGASFEGEHLLRSSSRLDYTVGYYYAEEAEPDRVDSVFLQEGVTFDPNVTPESIDPDNIRANPLDEDFGAFVLDELVQEDNITTEDHIVAELNYERPFSSSRYVGKWKAGVKFRDKNKDRDQEVFVFESETDIFLDDVADPSYGFDTTIIDGRYTTGPFVDPEGARSFVDELGLEGEKDREEDTGDYDATETTSAAYGQAEVYLSDEWMLLTGARYEYTDTEYTSFEVNFDSEGDWLSTTPISGSDDYGIFMPHLHLRYSPDGNQNVRFAITRTFARPDFERLAPFRLINQEDNEIERGNPNLDPTISWNVDLLYERFFESVGLFSAGAFYKNLDDNIYIFRGEEPFDGDTFDVLTPLNGESASLWGVELAYQKRLSFLPGLGIYVNYTYTDSEADFPPAELGEPGREATLPGQSENLGNLALSYERGAFAARLAYNFHGKYIAEVGETAQEDIYYDDREQLDFRATYAVAQGFRLYLELNNLTDEPLRFYQGSENRPIQEEYYSYWGQVGVTYAF
jgi:TonB-dependent receptor